MSQGERESAREYGGGEQGWPDKKPMRQVRARLVRAQTVTRDLRLEFSTSS